MKILFLDCSMGASGDMLMGALYDVLTEEEQKDFLETMAQLKALSCDISPKKDTKCGIAGTHMEVRIHGQEELEHLEKGHKHGRHLSEIFALLENLSLPQKVKEDAKAIYESIAQAESQAHNTTVTEVHFHEVGMLDAITDVVGCSLLFYMIQPQQVVVTPVNVGYGSISCAHGILPVPAPATALLLQNIPCYAGQIEGELCTPTGAAILAYFGTAFSQMPEMRIEKIGHGTGTKDFAAANVVRAMVGHTTNVADTIVELNCNLDDMTAEEIGFVTELLLEQGAKEVYTTAIGMKKNRPGVLLSVLCAPWQREEMAQLLFLHTTTLGIRYQQWNRMTLQRESREVEFSLGKVRRKEATGYGCHKSKVEYEDIKAIAKEKQMSLRQVKERLEEETGQQ